MTATARLLVELDVTGAQQGADALNRALNQTEQATSKLSSGLSSLATIACGYLSFQTLAAGVKAVFNETKEFDNSLRGLSSITGIVGSDLEALSRSADTMSVKWGENANEVLGVEKQLASLKPELANNASGLAMVTDEALKLSKAQTDLSNTMAAEAIGSTLNAYSLGVENAARVTDILAEASRLGAREVPFVAEGLSKVGALANTLGEDLTVPVAALEVLGKNMSNGSEAGTHLKAILASLVENAAKSGREFTSLSEELDMLAEGGFGAEEAISLFGKEMFNSAIHLVNNRTELEKLTDALDGSAGAAAKQAATNMGGLGGAVDKLSAQWSSLLRAIGDSEVFQSLVARASASIEGLKMLLADLGLIEDQFETRSEKYEKATQKMSSATADLAKNYEMLARNQERLKNNKGGPLGAWGIEGDIKRNNEQISKLVNELIPKYAEEMKKWAPASKEAASGLVEVSTGVEDVSEKIVKVTGQLSDNGMWATNYIQGVKTAFNDLAPAISDEIDALIESKVNWDEHNKALGEAEVTTPKVTESFNYLELQMRKLGSAVDRQIESFGKSERELAGQEFVLQHAALAALGYADALDKMGKKLYDGEQSARQFKNTVASLTDIGISFFNNLADDGTDAWKKMLEDWEQLTIDLFENRLKDVIKDPSTFGAGSQGEHTTFNNILGGAGAGYTMGNVAAGMQGQGTGSAMAQGALTGAVAGYAVGNWVGAIAGALVGAFTAGQSGQWQEVGRGLRLQIDDGLINGFMNVTERKYSFGSSRTREVMDNLGPNEQAGLQNVWQNFLGAFVDAGEKLDLGDLGERVARFISFGFNIDISGMSPDEVLAAANAEFLTLGSSIAGTVMPTLIALTQDGENLAEAFIRVGQAFGSVNTFFETIHLDPKNLVSEDFINSFVASYGDALLQDLYRQLNDAVAANAEMDDVRPGHLEDSLVDEIQAAIDNFEMTAEQIAQAQADAIYAWAADLETALGGFDAMNEKFGTVLSHFFDTSQFAIETMESQVQTGLDSFDDMLLGLGDIASGVDRSNFGQFLNDALSGALGAIDPETLAGIIDAATALAGVMDIEQDLAIARGETRDATSLTVDQIKILVDTAADWSRTLVQLGDDTQMARVGTVDFMLAVVDLVGGLDAANAKFQGFVEQWFTAEEQFSLLSGRLADAAQEVGLSLEDIDTPEEIRALMDQATAEGNAELMAFLLNWSSTIAEFQQGLGGLDGAADGATSAIDATSQALQENVQYWGQIVGAIDGAIAGIQNAIASIQSQNYALMGPGSMQGDIDTLYGQLGSGSIEDQIATIQQLQGMITQRYQLELQGLQQTTSWVSELSSQSGQMTQEMADAMREAHERAMSYWQRMSQVAKGLRDYLHDLQFRPEAPGTLADKIAAAQEEFARLLQLALGGDADAAEQLQGAAATLLDLARQGYASGEGYQDIYAMVVAGLEQVATMAEAIDEPPAWVEPVVGGLDTIGAAVNNGTGVNREAINRLQQSTIEELEALQDKLEELRAIAAAEETAAKLRLEEYQNNTEAAAIGTQRNTDEMVDQLEQIFIQGDEVNKRAPDWGSMLENTWQTANFTGTIMDEIIAWHAESSNSNTVVAALASIEGAINAQTDAIVDAIATYAFDSGALQDLIDGFLAGLDVVISRIPVQQ